MGNAFVVYKSPLIGIEIVVDRSQVLMSIGNQADSRKEWFEFSDVLKYFSALENAYIFDTKTEDNTWDEAIEAQLNRLAVVLRQYCRSLLKGDFSMKDDIKKIEENRVTKMLEQFKKVSRDSKETNL